MARSRPRRDQSTRIVALIRESFGKPIADEARSVLREPSGKNLSLLDLIATAERRFYASKVGDLEQFGKRRTDSRLEMHDLDDAERGPRLEPGSSDQD